MNRNFLKLLIITLLILSVCNLSAVNVQRLFISGGPFMYIISILLVIMLILAIVKYWQLSIKEKLDTQNFFLKIKGYVRNNQIREAIKISSQFKKTTIGFIFWSGLLGYSDGVDSGKKGVELQNHVQNAFDEAGLQAIPKIDAGLFWFDIIAQVATLLGLLGTIFGLVNAFDALATAAEADKSRLLTEGIAMAMGTTAYGLIVAIPTMLIKGALQARAEKIINDIDEFSVKAINQITYAMKD
ncbi:MAG: MotA/TolQ/ExbB proton channel family protein [Candidatus Cloacimonetes bacterium]|nr:MotA/TolQ/ExbB proton channel family protein [Candidatus Cloacimonadota bacterium]MCF7814444.1 MotA/TolQ/ExbB proton channel family protein [Candidatus Cloacimonadota bacterium]MCF7868794.1 MotA/TolQ/ExbB proton channel family protein [Candidatus Cloacimonadota bacterium]